MPIALFVIQLGFGPLLSPWGQIELVKWDIAKLAKESDQRTLIVIAKGLASAGYFKQAAEVVARIDSRFEKQRFGLRWPRGWRRWET